jgi:hypothetical protein
MVIGLSFNLNSNCLTYISQETRVENLLAKLYQEHALEMEGYMKIKTSLYFFVFHLNIETSLVSLSCREFCFVAILRERKYAYFGNQVYFIPFWG